MPRCAGALDATWLSQVTSVIEPILAEPPRDADARIVEAPTSWAMGRDASRPTPVVARIPISAVEASEGWVLSPSSAQHLDLLVSVHPGRGLATGCSYIRRRNRRESRTLGTIRRLPEQARAMAKVDTLADSWVVWFM